MCRPFSRCRDVRSSALEAGEAPAAVDAEWRRAEQRFSETVGKLNKLIDDYNLEIPAQVFYRVKINIEREIERLKTSQNQPGTEQNPTTR
jgi:hypothetical protein